MKNCIKLLLILVSLLAPMAAMAANPANITSFQNIAAIQALGSAAPFYPAVNVLGYATPGDGGGGLFYWNAASTATADNGIIISANGVGTGRWLRQIPEDHTINPIMFGAKCDGTTIDSTAVQNAENAAGLYQASIAFIGPKLCKVSVALTPKPGVDHYCAIGMNLANSDVTTGHDCGILEVGGSWAYDMPTVGFGIGSSIHAPTWHDMAIDSAAGGIRIGTSVAGSNQAFAAYLEVKRVTFSGPAAVQNLQCTLCFYAVVDQSWFVDPVQFYMSDYINVSNSSFQRQFNSDVQPQLLFLSDSTFGNDDVAYHNFFECPEGGGATSCVKSNANSVTFQDNGFECQGTGLVNIIDLTAPTTSGGFSNIIKDNQVACPSASATHWLSVENTQFLYYLFAEGNSCSCVFGSAIFNAGAGMPLYIPTTTVVSQIFHNGNANEAGFPWSSYNNLPETGSLTSGTLITFRPGSTSYNVSQSDYGATVAVLNGAYQQPASAGGNQLDFITTPSNFTGTLDVCFLASSSNAAQVETLVTLDNAVVLHTSTLTITGGASPQWYCYKGGVYATKATAVLKNLDTVRNAVVQIYQVTITQEL